MKQNKHFKQQNLKKLTLLFDAYSQNISTFLPNLNGVFVCPLCLRKFNKESVAKKEVSLEHIIPEELGGIMETITCRRCNNEHGSKLDAHIINLIRYQDFISGKSDRPKRIKVKEKSGGKYAADWYIQKEAAPKVRNAEIVLNDSEGNRISIVPQLLSSNPNLRRGAIESYNRGKFNVTISGKLGYKL